MLRSSIPPARSAPRKPGHSGFVSALVIIAAPSDCAAVVVEDRERRSEIVRDAVGHLPQEAEEVAENLLREQVQTSVEEVKPFPAVDRRRNLAVPSEQREKGEVAIFQELGKALTSSLQLDQVLRTIMEKKTLDDNLKAEMSKVIKEAKETFVAEQAAVK